MQGLREYTADHLLDFLNRQGDKDLMVNLVKGLGGKFAIEGDVEAIVGSEPFQ